MYRGLNVAVAIPAFRAETTVAEVIATLPPFVDHVVAVDDASPDGTGAALDAIQDAAPDGHPSRQEPRRGRLDEDRVPPRPRARRRRGREDGRRRPDGPGPADGVAGSDRRSGLRLHEGQPVPRLQGAGRHAVRAPVGQPRPHLPDQDGLRLLARLRSSERVRRLPRPRCCAGWIWTRSPTTTSSRTTCSFTSTSSSAAWPTSRCRRATAARGRRCASGASSPDFHGGCSGASGSGSTSATCCATSRPVALFLLAGIPLLLGGIGFGAWAWYESNLTGVVSSTGRVMLSVLPIVIGFQLILQAILLDIQSSPK